VGYDTVMHAIGDGWRLLGPPSSKEEGIYNIWWLEKEHF
jgi:hypothetical protein